MLRDLIHSNMRRVIPELLRDERSLKFIRDTVMTECTNNHPLEMTAHEATRGDAHQIFDEEMNRIIAGIEAGK